MKSRNNDFGIWRAFAIAAVFGLLFWASIAWLIYQVYQAVTR